MLQEMYLPGQNLVWMEAEILEKLNLLQLVPRKQSIINVGIQLDQFSLDHTQPFQAFSV